MNDDYQRSYYLKHREKKLAYAKKYREENPQAVSQVKKDWYKKNREATLTKLKGYYEANADSLKKKQSDYRKNNPEKIAESNAMWRAKNPEVVKEIVRRNRINNRETINETARRRRAKMYGTRIGPITKYSLKLRWDYFGGKCWICHGIAVEWDHVKPLAQGGYHMLSNMRPACRSCNASKAAKWPLAV